jgi:hypothetical protein
MKEMKILVKVDWEYNKEINELQQIFKFEDSKYIQDPSFIIHEKFEEKLMENIYKQATFKDMIRNNDNIIIKYKTEGNIKSNSFKPYFYNISSVIPDNEGCRFCRYYKRKTDYGECGFQQKDIFYEKKSCRFFKQRKINKS